MMFCAAFLIFADDFSSHDDFSAQNRNDMPMTFQWVTNAIRMGFECLSNDITNGLPNGFRMGLLPYFY